MTIEEYFRNELDQRGLFPEDIDEIMTETKISQAQDAMQERWNDNKDDYPKHLLTVIWMFICNRVTTKYPDAWFKVGI